MPQAIKALGVTTTTSATHYTCPADTCAKVLISNLMLTYGGSACSFTVGGVTFSMTGTGSLSHNGSQSESTGSTIIDDRLPPMEFYLAAGQTIASSLSSPSSVIFQATIIEEATS